MAGCSIVMLMLLLWPVMLVGSIACLALMATVEFVTSPAFPVLLVGLACHLAAAIDVGRLLWRKYKERDAFELARSLFVRPLTLICVGFALMLASALMAGGMVVAWYQSLQS